MRPTREELLQEAVSIAQKILSGELQPNAGCTLIGDINRELDWPPELGSLGLLAHDQTGHEHIGITAESCVPEIIDECRKLVAYAPSFNREVQQNLDSM